ncbi:MAG: translation elongation factor Ts [Bacilli bacterium]
MISANLVKELREKSGAGMLDCKKALEATTGDINAAMDYLREKGIASALKKQTRIAAEGLASILINGNKAAIIEVNSETDFVAKNEEFKDLVDTILEKIINSDVKTVEEALQLNGINDLLIAKTSKIGEKLSLRRFNILNKLDNQCFGSYIHMGGKIAVLTIIENASEEVAKDVSMHAAAMRPKYVNRNQVSEEEILKERIILKEQAINEGKSLDIAEKMVEGRIQKFYKEVCLEEQPFVKDSDINVATYVKNNNGKILDMIRFEVGEGMEKRNENFADEVAKQING